MEAILAMPTHPLCPFRLLSWHLQFHTRCPLRMLTSMCPSTIKPILSPWHSILGTPSNILTPPAMTTILLSLLKALLRTDRRRHTHHPWRPQSIRSPHKGDSSILIPTLFTTRHQLLGVHKLTTPNLQQAMKASTPILPRLRHVSLREMPYNNKSRYTTHNLVPKADGLFRVGSWKTSTCEESSLASRAEAWVHGNE